jgi:hypothetical protein
MMKKLLARALRFSCHILRNGRPLDTMFAKQLRAGDAARRYRRIRCEPNNRKSGLSHIRNRVISCLELVGEIDQLAGSQS